jgi:hypothetical protein
VVKSVLDLPKDKRLFVRDVYSDDVLRAVCESVNITGIPARYVITLPNK